MDLAALADFNLVATHGGLGRASRASGRPKATLSRRVAELESSLGVRLFERGLNSLQLTEEGHTLYAQTQGPLNEINETGETIKGNLAGPRGRLRINTPMLFGHIAMGRIAATFAKSYPQVRLEITAEDRFVDPVEEGYDIVIRVNPRPDDQLVGRCFLKDKWLLVAPASLPRPLAANGAVGASIPAVVRTNMSEPGSWRISTEGREETFLPDPVLRLSSMIMVRDAVSAGAGAGLLPHFMVAEELRSGRLVTWGVVIDHSVEVWVLHTSRRLVSSKVTAFVQFMIASFPDASL